MPAANHDVATGGKDVAHDVASRKNPGVQDGIVDPADEGGMRPVQHHDVTSLARGKADTYRSEPECPHAAGAHGLQQCAARRSARGPQPIASLIAQALAVLEAT